MGGLATFKELGRYGRLGNQMFQIASTIGIAKRNNIDFAFPRWKNYDHLERFGSSEDIDVQKFFINELPELRELGPFQDLFVHWGYWPVLVNGFVNLSGHMQSEKYFLHCEDLVRHYFKMTTPDSPIENTVAIHCRFGDYDDAYHPVMKMDYYEKAMAEFPSSVKWLVFSDDLNKAQQYFGSNASYPDGNDYMVDFWLMRQCSDFIIGNSTYSWWAAWLSENKNKKVVAPSKWFGEVAGLSSQDLYCQNWIVI
jgi:hypothetical protein